MKNLKRIFAIFLLCLTFFITTFAENNKTTLNLFYSQGCPHCEKEMKFLEKIEPKYENLEIKKYEIHTEKGREILKKISEKMHIQISGVPFTLIGKKHITGFGSEETTGKKLEDSILYCEKNICKNFIENLDKTETGTKNTISSENINNEKNINYNVSIPFIGELNLKNFSIPIIAMIIGILDGFNPCAMWILLFLISMLLGMENKKRMWILGSTFIFTSALIYFIFMAAWLNIIIFLGFIVWIRALIGIFAIIGGTYNLYQYQKTKDTSGCSVVGKDDRKKMFDRIKCIIYEKNFFISILGICLLAISVNLVELLCSAGLPVIFTQILEVNNLNIFQKYLYIILYIFFFMLDDLIVFFVSMKTLEATGITTKYTKYSHLIGGILMVIIGILLIFKPEILMFG